VRARPRHAGAAALAAVLATACSGGAGAASAGPGGSPSTTGGDSAATASSGGPHGTATASATGETAPTTGADSTTGPDAGGTGAPPLVCNGAEHLCDRPFDRVIFPGTHNAFSATEAGFSSIVANQHRTLAEQLDDGIRLLLLDITEDGGETALCHQFCTFGKTPHLDALADIRAFLEANPSEVIAIIYQDDVPGTAVEQDMATAGLDGMLYTHPPGAPWPTLRTLIEQGTRLVVFAEAGGPPPPWWHHAWDHVWDTPYTFNDPADFNCMPNRGDPQNPLFLVNHWLSTTIGLPDEGRAAEANAYDVLDARIQACLDLHGRLPTFVAVDFYDVGDLLAVVRDRNAP